MSTPTLNKDLRSKQLQSGEWTAYWSNEQDMKHAGYGKTEGEAVADLFRLDTERAEALEGSNEA